MIFDVISKKDPKIERMYNKAMKELNKFFELNWVRNKPKIFLMKDRKTIDAFRGDKTPDWVVGWIGSGSIYVLDRKSYGKESRHKYSDKEYSVLLQHELAHLFFHILSGYKHHPDWLWEGTATYVSGQNKTKKKPKKFEKFLGFYDKKGPEVYRESGFAIELLVKKYSKQKLLKLIKSLQEVKNQTQFNKSFKKIYKFRPTYKKFNEILNKKELN